MIFRQALIGKLSPVGDNAAMEESNDPIGVGEAAEIIGLDRARIKRLLAARRLRGKKVAGRWLIRRADAEKFRDIDRPPGRPKKVAS